MAKITHSRKHRSKKQRRSRSTRIIYVAIRSVKTPSAGKNTRSIDTHRIRSVDDRANIKSVTNYSECLLTMTTNSKSLQTLYPNDPKTTSVKTRSNVTRSGTDPLQVKGTWANPSDYARKHYQKNRNKKKYIRWRCLIMILFTLFILIIASTILVILLLPKSKVKINWSNTLYIADRNNHRIQKYLRNASSGETVAGQASGTPGSGSNFLNGPTHVKVDLNGNIYVADTSNNRVQLWNFGSSIGVTIAGTGTAGYSFNQLYNPHGIARDPVSNAIYIADYSNNRIMYYPAGIKNGTLVAGGNGLGVNSTQLYNPVGLYLDIGSNSLLIANMYANNVVRWMMGASGWILVAGQLSGTSSNTSNGLSLPTGVILDPMGNTYITDYGNQRIQFFPVNEMNGVTIAGTTSLVGNNASLFYNPISLVLDNQLNLYVSDYNNHRVQKFMRY